MPIEAPQSFVVHQECEKAAWDHGFRRQLGVADGWAGFKSTTVPGAIYLAASGAQGPWFLALDHAGVIDELDLTPSTMSGPGLARYAFENLGGLYAVLLRVYRLSASLPDAPFQEFQAKTKKLPKTTEAEQLIVRRVGQDIFRAGLLDYWGSRCPLTGIADTALLRASHIIRWEKCESDAERLNIHNGLLLSALWDAAFDRGLVTFNDDGEPQFSPALGAEARAELRWKEPIPLTDKHRVRLAWHRTNVFIHATVKAPDDAL